MNGSATEKPLFYYIDHSFDIMYYLSVHEQTTQFNKMNLNVRDPTLIKNFLDAVPISQNFHDLITDVLVNSYFVARAKEKVKNKI